MTVKYSTVENPSASCGRVFAILSVCLSLFAFGCRKNVIDPSKVVWSIFVGDECVGSGVFLGRVDNDGQKNVVLLTARHVVTYNRNCSESLDVVIPGAVSRMRLRSPIARWFTSRVRSVDCAWLVLEEDELRDFEYLEWVDLDATLESRAAPEIGDGLIVANARKTVPGVCQGFRKITVFFPKNKVLKKINMNVVCTSALTVPSDSGSGVFLSVDGIRALRLAGTTTASGLDRDYTAFLSISNIIDNVAGSLTGDYDFRLISCENMW